MRNPRIRNERGVALILVLLSLLLITAITMGMILLSNTEINVNANYKDEQVALFAAKAGLEEARDRMLATNSHPITLPTILPGASGGAYAAYITATGASPWLATNAYTDVEYPKEMGLTSLPTGSTWYSSAATQTSYSGPSTNPVPYRWVRINLKIDRSAYSTGTPYYVDGNSANASKQVCYDSVNLHQVVITTATCSAANSNYLPIYVATSFAQTNSGSQRMLQYELTSIPFNLTLPGALTIDGPLPSGAASICGSGSTCNGSGAYITGDNPSSCTTGSNLPAIATTDTASTSNLVTAITSNKANIVGAGGSPSVVNESSALSNLSTVTQVEALVSQMETLAGSNVGADCSTLNLGTAAKPTITVVTNQTGSACSLNSGTTGYGILVVTGTLDYVNINSYQGVILMLGTGQFISSSSKDTTFTGAMFIAQDRNSSTGALLAGPGLGTPSFNYHHGNASSSDPSIQYNSCVVSQVESLVSTNFKVLLQREMMF